MAICDQSVPAVCVWLAQVRGFLLTGVAFTATLAAVAGPVLAADVTTYTYDEARTGAFNVGRLTSVTEGGVTIRMDYDANGNIIRKTWEIAGQTYQHTFSYAQNGQVIQKTFAGVTPSSVTSGAATTGAQ
ncbi:hypothetical protein [Pannonibacter tanglangensis]|uniref:YD repeat-containing protein n=1 Tax=Pannonibacter tanglangensis TaxID=2750084 RepID=A0ABW9ZME4_9HYPH|nr:hypothetical protein [Pannonibacter sp. XCT-34]NBN66083.1 hypothetical protein [Pannonibacter sp. XCT-34]